MPENQYLLHHIQVESDTKDIKKSDIKKNIRQRPNTRILGVVRFHLGLYNLSGKKEQKRINRWLRSIGEAPVIYDKAQSVRTSNQIQLYLTNRGYYEAAVKDSVSFRKREAWVTYHVSLGPLTRISQFQFTDKHTHYPPPLSDTTALMQEIFADSASTLLRTGSPLDIDLLDLERERITRALREKGYYYFSKNFIDYFADTNRINNSAEILGSISSLPTADTYEKYRVGKISIDFDYDPVQVLAGRDTSYIETTYREHIIKYHERLRVSPKLIIETIQFKQGELYDVQKVIDSYSRLQALNLFKFVNIAFRQEENEQGENLLSCEIQLTPLKRQSYNVFLEGTHNSGNIGVGGNFTYSHRNLFKGGENFTISLWGALKKEQLNEGKIFSTKEIGVETKLITPEFWMPVFKFKDFRKNFAPKTSIALSYSYEYTPFYDRRTAGVKYGYFWRKADRLWRFNLDLVDFNYVMMHKVDKDFIAGLRNEYIKRAYTSHLLLSANFISIYTDQVLNSPSSYNYARINVESSGNLLYGISKIFGNSKAEKDGQRYFEALGVQYAQYIKTDWEYRFNQYINRANTMVYRVLIGCGYPYGNIKVLPFEKAFYSGGANSLRAWQARTLGPGSYNSGNSYPNSVGDFKIEANIEYRYKLFWLLEGAIFLDSGNVWNINKFENREESTLTKNFYKQIAIGTGTGIRLDANFFLFRFDWGIKMRDPIKEAGHRFVLFDNGKWLKHTVVNIAIGYPF